MSGLRRQRSSKFGLGWGCVSISLLIKWKHSSALRNKREQCQSAGVDGDVGGEGDILLVVVELDGKVLPIRLVNSNIVQTLATAIQDLEVALVGGGPTDDLAGLELDLVGRVVCRLVPDILSTNTSANYLQICVVKAVEAEVLTRYSCVKFNGLAASCLTLQCSVLTPTVPGPSLVSFKNCSPALLNPFCVWKIL